MKPLLHFALPCITAVVFIHAVIDKYEEQIKLKIIQTQGKAKNAGMIFLLNTLGFNMFN